MNRWFHSAAFGLTTVLMGIAVLVSPAGMYIEREFGLQWLFTLRGPVEPPAKVAVVGINSRSGLDMGLSRLPRHWPRSVHAVLTKRVMASGADGLVFDFDFSQPKAAIEDLTFADAIREAERVVLFERLEGRNERIVSGDASSRWVWVESSQPPTEPLEKAARAIAPFPLPKIEKSAFQFWAFKPSADDTPTTPAVAVQLSLMSHYEAWRHMLEQAGVQSELAPTARALKAPGALRRYMKDMRKLFLGKPHFAERLNELLETSTLSPEERKAVEVLLALYGGPNERYTNYYGPPGSIPTVSYQDMVSLDEIASASGPINVSATEASRRLNGRMVFVGYSDLFSPDQPDRFYTVFTSEKGIDLSGCEIMATAFANLLTDQSVQPLNPGLSLAIIVAVGLVASQLVFWPTAYVGVPLVVLVGAAYASGAARLFEAEFLWAPMATPLAVQMPFAIVAGLLGQYLLERRQKLRVSEAIAHYLPEHLVKDFTAGTLDEARLNRVVHGVCLATDMSGFSTISETKSPKELATFMNAYFEAIATALKRCEVDVTEFHADTIMCGWLGEPDDQEVRRKAVHAAIEVVHAIESFTAEDPNIRLVPRVGLQDGHFYLGHTGGGGRLSYSILGDPANSAARLESLNKKFGTRILAARSVVEGLEGFAVRPLGEFQVVGKTTALPVVEIIELASECQPETEQLCQGFAESLEDFFAGRWDAAAESFSRLASLFPEDRASAFYQDVSRRYAAGSAPSEHPTRLTMTEK